MANGVYLAKNDLSQYFEFYGNTYMTGTGQDRAWLFKTKDVVS